MVEIPWRRPPLTREQADDLSMLLLDDDGDYRPALPIGDALFWGAGALAHSLRAHARRHRLGWYVAGGLPMLYDERAAQRRLRLIPAVLVAFVAGRPRAAFDVAAEGGHFPDFVLDILSPEEADDGGLQRRVYELMGAREYAVLVPRESGDATLTGHRQDASGTFAPWLADRQGRLWSEVLGLYLLAQGTLLRAQTPTGDWLPTPEEAEDELDRLRRELARQRRDANG